MNAAEARRLRKGTTLSERIRKDTGRASRIDRLVSAASVEYALQEIMEAEKVNAAELARRIKAKPPQISRDLHGGLRKATVSRLVVLGQALDCEFIPMFIRKGAKAERRIILDAYARMLSRGRKPLTTA
jgi:Cro/C1-type helix-turn-helix DNA-binding protein